MTKALAQCHQLTHSWSLTDYELVSLSPTLVRYSTRSKEIGPKTPDCDYIHIRT